jgi:hypothetical protein
MSTATYIPADGLAIPDPKDVASWGDRKLNNAIRRGHAAAGAHMAAYEETATMTGVLLLERKRRLGHGQWLSWLEKNFKGSERTARRYLELAEQWLANRPLVTDFEPTEEPAPEPSTRRQTEEERREDERRYEDFGRRWQEKGERRAREARERTRRLINHEPPTNPDTPDGRAADKAAKLLAKAADVNDPERSTFANKAFDLIREHQLNVRVVPSRFQSLGDACPS